MVSIAFIFSAGDDFKGVLIARQQIFSVRLMIYAILVDRSCCREQWQRMKSAVKDGLVLEELAIKKGFHVPVKPTSPCDPFSENSPHNTGTEDSVKGTARSLEGSVMDDSEAEAVEFVTICHSNRHPLVFKRPKSWCPIISTSVILELEKKAAKFA